MDSDVESEASKFERSELYIVPKSLVHWSDVSAPCHPRSCSKTSVVSSCGASEILNEYEMHRDAEKMPLMLTIINPPIGPLRVVPTGHASEVAHHSLAIRC